MNVSVATALKEKRWYIVHAYSNFEKKVAESIREQAKQRGLEELFEQVLVPTEKVTEVRRGRKVDTERKFFPGYVLVKMNLTDEAFHLIKNTPKVTGFLGADNKPMPISEAEAMRILHQVQEGVERPKPSVSFEIARRRRPVRFVLGRGGGNRRSPFARKGRGFDLRPRHPGGTRVHPGGKGLRV
jgi:transcriptional antiterminator NusG